MSDSTIQVDKIIKNNASALTLVNPTIQGYLGSSIGKTVSYVITDADNYSRIACDTTSGDITVTLPLKGNNIGRTITIANVKGGTNKVIISPNATDANKLSNDGLNVIWLPKIGDYAVFQEDATSGFWEIVNERISCQLQIDSYAGYGSTDIRIIRLTNLTESSGNMFSENHSTGYSTNAKGLEITINRSGKYSFHFSYLPNGAEYTIGFSKNSNQLTTAIQSITTATYLVSYFNSGSAAHPVFVSYTGNFIKSDVFRLHGDGNGLYATAYTRLTATYLG